MDIPINYIAVLGGAIASIAIGFLWYGPLFGKKWVELSGRTSESMQADLQKRGAALTYGLQIAGALIMSYVLAHAVIFGTTYTGTFGFIGGMTAAFWYWLGIALPITLGDVLWHGRPWGFWMITSGYYLASMLAMGAILGGFV